MLTWCVWLGFGCRLVLSVCRPASFRSFGTPPSVLFSGCWFLSLQQVLGALAAENTPSEAKDFFLGS